MDRNGNAERVEITFRYQISRQQLTSLMVSGIQSSFVRWRPYERTNEEFLSTIFVRMTVLKTEAICSDMGTMGLFGNYGLILPEAHIFMRLPRY
jgi:hypothetical protein